MAIEVSPAEGEEALNEFLLFHNRVYENRPVHWPEFVPFRLPLLLGTAPSSKGRTFRPFVARQHGKIVARAAAVVDSHYIDRWQEPLGHMSLFEAMPQAGEATKALADAACEWLAGQGMRAARAGFGPGDFPFAIDDYDTLPPTLLRQNPPYYHRFLKNAGFESEKAWCDYKIEVTTDLLARWRDYLESAERSGFKIIPLSKAPSDLWLTHFTETWNDAFDKHWANTPQLEEEFSATFSSLEPFGIKETSVLAYDGDEPVGVVWASPEASAMAVASGRPLRDDEKVNFLGIGVRERARRRGVNLAMAAYAYLDLAARGAKYLSYTLVLDDNWPSRRTAEKLGASVCANYMVYRRNFA